MSELKKHTLDYPPKGFHVIVLNVGIKDETKDFVCIFSEQPCNAVGVFTQSRFAGPSVTLSRAHLQDGCAQALIAISKNANVANGKQGEDDAATIVKEVAKSLFIQTNNVLIGSTGVIGRRYPMDRVLESVKKLDRFQFHSNFIDAAHGIMTTDTVAKYASKKIGNAHLVGIAKGVGMIEPHMATLLAFFFTDAAIARPDLDRIFRNVMDRTFNCLSIDTDTSTSDSAIIFANGVAGPVDLGAFEDALFEMSKDFVKCIARDGEGATKRIEVHVDQARDFNQARMVAKAIVNSPLVKTAVHGADPNWGRIAMAIGKCESELDIVPENVIIRFDGVEVYPKACTESDLDQLKSILKGEDVRIAVSLNTGEAEATVWGCDLSAEYVRINGEYTT